MIAVSFAEYTVAGGIAGAAFNGLGATLLHLGSPDRFDRSGAALAGFIGGSVTHSVYGVLSALDGEPGMGEQLQRLGRSMPLAALTSGLVGGVFLGLADVPRPDAAGMVLSGLVGGVVIGLAATTASLAARAMCMHRPGWTAIASGDLETGERLMGPEAEEHHPEASAVQRIAATFQRAP